MLCFFSYLVLVYFPLVNMLHTKRVGLWILIALAALTHSLALVEGKRFDHDLVYQQASVVRQRLSQVQRFLLPIPDHQWDLLERHFSKLLFPVNSTSDTCRDHSQHLLESFMNQETWAMRMVDSSSKLQSGILDGHVHNLGSYSQCISITEPSNMFQGQHCALETTGLMPPEIADSVMRESYPYIDRDGMFSLCVPSSCSDHDVITHVDSFLSTLGASSKHYLEDLGLSTEMTKINCSSGRLPFRRKDYCSMLIFAILILVVTAATIVRPKSGWLSYFSLLNNIRELMKTDTLPSDITCLSGLKVILTIQVMVVHRVFTVLFLPINNTWTVSKAFDTFTIAVVECVYERSVEIFFLLGGLVLSFSFFMKIRRKEDFHYLSFVLKRYFRITPVLAAMALFDATLLIHTSHGPLWRRNVSFYEDTCHRNWWTSLLHISNLVNPDYTCVLESWYLACDFQLHCVAPVLLLLLLRRPRLGLVIIFLCLSLSMAALVAVACWLQISTGYCVAIAFWDRLTDLHIALYYKLPIFRGYPFLMGLMLGYAMYYYKQKKVVRLSKRTAWIGWTITNVTIAGLVLANLEVISPDHEYNLLLDLFLVGFSRSMYCACISWIVFACYFGCGGLLNSLLSWRGFHPLAKLGFSAYLVHINIIIAQQAAIQSAITVRFIDQLFLHLGDVAVSYIVAAVLYTTVELPFYRLALRRLTGLGGKPSDGKKQ